MNKNTLETLMDEIAERFAEKFFKRYEEFLVKMGDSRKAKEINERRRFATVREITELYPSFSQSSIRWLIFNEKTNGFSQCIKRVGRKILIDLNKFEQWIDKHE